MKEAWSLHTVKRNLVRPTLIEFDWFEDRAEAHERPKTASGKTKGDESTQFGVTKNTTTSKVSATTSINQRKTNSNAKSDNVSTNFVAYKEKLPLCGGANSCFSCLNDGHSLRQSPQPRKCIKEGRGSSHNRFRHGADRFFPNKNQALNKRNLETSSCIGSTKVGMQADESRACRLLLLLRVFCKIRKLSWIPITTLRKC